MDATIVLVFVNIHNVNIKEIPTFLEMFSEGILQSKRWNKWKMHCDILLDTLESE